MGWLFCYYNSNMKHPLFEQKPVVIGMVHFSALEGSDDFRDADSVLTRARDDMAALLEGHVDAIMFENNFDTPKYERLPALQRAHFSKLVRELAPLCSVPWGISALWNDYTLGFELCAELGGIMVRVPVFVDDIETTYGSFYAHPQDVVAARNRLAPNVLLLTDVHVKHARMLRPRPFADSVREALQNGTDAIIVTGQWTGDPPTPDQCDEAKRLANGDAYVLTGSGMTAENMSSFTPYIDGCIVGTAFKEGDINLKKRSGPNIVKADRRYSLDRIKEFMSAVRG